MAKANKFKNVSAVNVHIFNVHRKSVTLKPGEIVRYGKNPPTTYFLNTQEFKAKRDWNYLIGQEPGDCSTLTCVAFSKAGTNDGLPDNETNYHRNTDPKG